MKKLKKFLAMFLGTVMFIIMLAIEPVLAGEWSEEYEHLQAPLMFGFMAIAVAIFVILQFTKLGEYIEYEEGENDCNSIE